MNVAARHMLPVEMLCAATSVVFGVASWLGRGPLWWALHDLQPSFGIGQEAWWGGTLIVLGALLLFAACLEWFDGRHWGESMLMLTADVRCACALLLSVALMSLFFTVVVLGDGMRHFFFVALAPVLTLFLLWAAVMTRRLSVCLDKKYRTPALQRNVVRDW